MPSAALGGGAMNRVVAGLLLSAVACATRAPTLAAVNDIDGVRQAPLDALPGQLHVVIFVTADCPIANAYAPTIQALRREFETQAVHFFLVHVDEQLDASGARVHADEYGLVGPILLDPAHDLVRAVGATITPEVAVLGPARVVLYRGRIDNWFGDLGKKRPQPTRHDLRDAIHALLSGTGVPEARTAAIGCSIE